MLEAVAILRNEPWSFAQVVVYDDKVMLCKITVACFVNCWQDGACNASVSLSTERNHNTMTPRVEIQLLLRKHVHVAVAIHGTLLARLGE